MRSNHPLQQFADTVGKDGREAKETADKLAAGGATNLRRLDVSSASDTAPTAGGAARKKVTLQFLAGPPTNAAYIAFSNNPAGGTFYLVIEDA